MKEGVIAYLLLGSNVGDRHVHLAAAREALAEKIEIVCASAVYETDAWGDRSQDSYFNQALMVRTALGPQQLHTLTRAIERKMGRKEKGNYQPRNIDIDILFYRDEMIRTKNLIIPHPRIQIRKFVLAPMSEIAADHIHPVLMKTMEELLMECDDQLGVVKVED